MSKKRKSEEAAISEMETGDRLETCPNAAALLKRWVSGGDYYCDDADKASLLLVWRLKTLLSSKQAQMENGQFQDVF